MFYIHRNGEKKNSIPMEHRGENENLTNEQTVVSNVIEILQIPIMVQIGCNWANLGRGYIRIPRASEGGD